MLEQILQSLLIIVAIGLMLLVLYQIVKVSGALFLIGLISGLVFIEIYGIYLFFHRERSLYRRFSHQWYLEFYWIFL